MDLVNSSGEFVHADMKNVPVIIKWSQYKIGGLAMKGKYYNKLWAEGKKNIYGFRVLQGEILVLSANTVHNYVNMNGGLIKITLPKKRLIDGSVCKWGSNHRDILRDIQHVWEVLVHEWCHIIDYQSGNHFTHARGVEHDRQAAERSVYNRIYDLKNVTNHYDFHKQISLPNFIQDAILNLSIWIESNLK